MTGTNKAPRKKTTSAKNNDTSKRGQKSRRNDQASTHTHESNSSSDTNNASNAPPQPLQTPPAGPSSTLASANTNVTDAEREIRRLTELVNQLQRERAEQQNAQPAATAPAGVTHSNPPAVIPQPEGQISKDFHLKDAMGLSDNTPLYKSISRTLRTAAIQANVMDIPTYRQIPPEKLVPIFRKVREAHPYMDRRRFPNDWATAELLKQYMRNHRKHLRALGVWGQNTATPTQLPNIDDAN